MTFGYVASKFKDNSNPKYIGPGYWDFIHRYAYNSRTHEEQLLFISIMKFICENFNCGNCREHCKTYIKNHPMEQYLDLTIDVENESLQLGMFMWSWKFHNAVNVRIKNPIMSWDTAYNLYSPNDNLVCSKYCIATNSPQPNIKDYYDNSIVPDNELNFPKIKEEEFKLITPPYAVN